VTTGDEIVIEVEFAIAEWIEAVFFCRAGQCWHAQGRKRASGCVAPDARPSFWGLHQVPLHSRNRHYGRSSVPACNRNFRQKALPSAKPAGRVPDVSRQTMRCALRTLMPGWRIWRSQSRHGLRGGNCSTTTCEVPVHSGLRRGRVGGQARSSRIMPTTVTKG
jgi:hypothetical protein